MRILKILASIDPAGGGPIEGVRNTTTVMQGMGIEVEIACLDAPGSFRDSVEESPWKIHQLGPPRLGNYSYSPHFKPWLMENLTRFDAVIIQGIWQYHDFASSRACRKKKVPYFVYSHGMLDPWFNVTYPLKKLKKQLYWRWGQFPVLKHAETMLFTCEEEKQLARKSFRPYSVTESVVGYGTYKPPESRQALREKLEEQNLEWAQRPYFLFLSRVQEKKGLDLLVEAYAELRAQNSGIPDLVIAGPIQQKDYADRLKTDFPQTGIHWVPMLNNREKWSALAGAEAMTLTSHQENFGLVVAEALAVGTPVLISDKVNIWREAVEGGAGFVETDSVTGAKSLLRSWLELSDENKAHMRMRAEQVFQENFEIEKVTRNLIECIKSHLPS